MEQEEIEFKVNKSFNNWKSYIHHRKAIVLVLRLKKRYPTWIGYRHNYTDEFEIFDVRHIPRMRVRAMRKFR